MTVDHLLSGLKPIRHFRGMSLAEAADVIGVMPTSYARFEAGSRRIYLDKAKALADALGCTLDDLTTYRTADELFHHLKPWSRPVAGQVPAPPAETTVPPPPAPALPADDVEAVLHDWDAKS